MVKIYCSEGQKVASLILNIEGKKTKIDFDNPPITIDFISNAENWTTSLKPGYTMAEPGITDWYETYADGDFYRIEIGRFFNTNSIRFYYIFIENNDNETRPIIFTLPGLVEMPNEVNPFVAYNIGIPGLGSGTQLKVTDKNDVEFTSDFPVGSNYKINCDGCDPGNCKGNKEKYPGYVCFDCKKMQSQILNMESKLSG